MECPRCEADIPAGNRFCEACGAPVPKGCPSCGASIRPGAKFCGQCGGALAAATATAPTATPTRPSAPQAAPPASSAERRQLTVMFCDLVGSTALAARIDPEDLREIIGAYHPCVAETVARFDGFVAKYMGDGVLVYFGYPQAHEDDAERAVRAGLALDRGSRSAQGTPSGCGFVSASPPASSSSAISSAPATPRSEASSAKRRTWRRACRRWPSRTAW